MSGPLIIDYTSLQTAIAEWLWRVGDAVVVNRVPDFINFFESDFARDQRTRKMEEVDTTPVSGAQFPLPAGFLEMIRLQLTGLPQGLTNDPLVYVTPVEQSRLDATVFTSGLVKNYTTLAGNIILTPQAWAPSGATLEMAYYSFIKLAVAPGGVNWLITDFPNLYLYGSLLHASAYIDDDRILARWKSGHDEAMDKLLKSDNKAKLGAGPLIQTPSARFRR